MSEIKRSPFIDGFIDFRSLRENGWTQAVVSPLMTGTLLKCLSEEDFVLDYESKDGDGYEPSPTAYSNMYVAKNRMSDRPGGFYETWLEHLMAWASPLVGMYMYQPTGLDSTLAITQCKKGYFMDWHHDAGERAVAIGLLYLNESEVTEEDGGALLVCKTSRDCDGNVVEREVTGKFRPTHGTLILLDASTVEFEHSVTEYNGNTPRYCLSAVMGMPREEL
jgi:hypothetical protein